MILYHGSNIEIESIDLTLSRPNKDFGKGFYLSENLDQAMNMAEFKVELLGGTPVINKFLFDETEMNRNSLNCLRFPGYTKEWAEFVFNNRFKVKFHHDYDVVIGPMANDKVGAQIRRYAEGDITFEIFLERLKYMKGVTFQYFFGTERALDLLNKVH